jgi:aspartyl aminopeptidase
LNVLAGASNPTPVPPQPILGLVEKSLNTPATNDAPAEATTAAAAPENQQPAFTSESMSERHHSVLLDVIAAELDCDVQDIHDFELWVLFSFFSSPVRRVWRGFSGLIRGRIVRVRSLYDTQPATVLGINNEFISSPRLDNQMTW